jgi:DNA polymerase III subunit gamma/tau
MAYQVLARKYRPQRFSDVVGQEHVTQTLGNAIQQNRIAHAFLFCGPRGTGKTTIARIFAKCLNCTGGPKVDFDDADPRCQEIAEGRSMDVLEIDGASNRGIDEIRELRETVKYAPASSRFKVYIIDEVHMLTKEAFNALLKTLEEPPEHVKFMFATTEPDKVLPTILSRCQRFDLRRIPVALIVRHLDQIAKKENTKIDEAAVYAIARGAEGCMRDAESALDQLISFCGDTIAESDVLSMFGLTGQGQMMSLASAILNGDANTALRQVNDLSKHGKDLGRLLSDLLGHFRNLLIFQISKGDTTLLEVAEAELANIKEQAALVTTEALTHVMEVLTDSEGRLRDASSKKIFVEVALLKAIHARQAVSIDTVLQQLTQLRGGDGATPAPKAIPAHAPASAPQIKTPPRAAMTAEPAQPISTAPSVLSETHVAAPRETMDLPTLWPHLLEAIGRVSVFMKSSLHNARPISWARNILTIGFDPEFASNIELVNNSRTITIIQTKLHEMGYPNAHVKFIQAETPAPAPAVAAPVTHPAPEPPKPAAPAMEKGDVEMFKKDPLVVKALELFKGAIVEVRT